MSAIDDLLIDLQAQGIGLRICDGVVQYYPRSAMTETLLARLRAMRSELLASSGLGEVPLPCVQASDRRADLQPSDLPAGSRDCSDGPSVDLVRVNVAFQALSYLLAVQSPRMVPDGIIPGRSLDSLESRLRVQALLSLTGYLGEVVS